MDLISKALYTDKLAAILDRSNNAYYRTMKIKSIDIKTTTYIDFDVKNSDKDSKFKSDDHIIRISKYKTFQLHDTHQIGLKKFLLLTISVIYAVTKTLEHFNFKQFKGMKLIDRDNSALFVI